MTEPRESESTEPTELEREIEASTDKSLRGVAQAFIKVMLRERSEMKSEVEAVRERILRGGRLTKDRFDI